MALSSSCRAISSLSIKRGTLIKFATSFFVSNVTACPRDQAYYPCMIPFGLVLHFTPFFLIDFHDVIAHSFRRCRPQQNQSPHHENDLVVMHLSIFPSFRLPSPTPVRLCIPPLQHICSQFPRLIFSPPLQMVVYLFTLYLH